MTYLLDTNVISEVRKGKKCHPRVAEWYESVAEEDLFLSVLVLGEIRKGIEKARPSNPAFAKTLDDWLTKVEGFGERILAIDQAVAYEWGRMNAVRTVPVIDGLLAATANVHGLILVTRNEDDVRGLGANTFDPFGTE